MFINTRKTRIQTKSVGIDHLNTRESVKSRDNTENDTLAAGTKLKEIEIFGNLMTIINTKVEPPSRVFYTVSANASTLVRRSWIGVRAKK